MRLNAGPYELLIGWRYTRAGRSTRRNGFISFISAASIIGTLAGLALGLAVALNIDVIVPFFERLFNTSFLPQDIYLISKMPSDPQASDIVPIVVVSLILSFLATLYPSWRASRVNPAEALRHE